jgi:hypothetical protein
MPTVKRSGEEMKNGIFLAGCFALAAFSPLAVMAQGRPAAPRTGAVEADEDAPPPVAQVFEVQAIQLAAPIARPAIAPALPPAAAEPPMIIGPDGAPAHGDSQPVDRVRVQLNDSSQIVGEIAPTTPLVIRAKFGEVKLTFEDIARIDGAVDDGHWRVTLTSGDRITGETKLTGLKLATAIGEVQLDEAKIASVEVGKLHTQQFAVARTSPDGRTRSVAYRQRQVFAPLMPEASNPHNGFQPTSAYAPNGCPVPMTPTFSGPDFSAPTAPSTRLLPTGLRPR